MKLNKNKLDLNLEKGRSQIDRGAYTALRQRRLAQMSLATARESHNHPRVILGGSKWKMLLGI